MGQGSFSVLCFARNAQKGQNPSADSATGWRLDATTSTNVRLSMRTLFSDRTVTALFFQPMV